MILSRQVPPLDLKQEPENELYGVNLTFADGDDGIPYADVPTSGITPRKGNDSVVQKKAAEVLSHIYELSHEDRIAVLQLALTQVNAESATYSGRGSDKINSLPGMGSVAAGSVKMKVQRIEASKAEPEDRAVKLRVI